MQWKNRLVNIARHLDDEIDKVTNELRHRLGVDDPVQIVSYRTYGTPYKIYVRGRVLEDKGITSPGEQDNMWDNIMNMYRRFETDEVSGARIKLILEDEEHIVTSDKEGYFVFDLNPVTPVFTTELYHTIELELIHSDADVRKETAEIMIPPADAEYGIISDIDDTIIRSNATSFLAMGKTVLLGNARTRLPYAGVTEFYRALQLGRNGKRNNPFFYVSSSPWNLYDLIIDFMDHNKIPQGPLLLRDFGLQSDSFIKHDYLSHKLKEISQILDTYPKLNFILIGDSGEHDPSIYLEVVKKFPGRIIAIYIRDVNNPQKKLIATEVANSLKALNVEMVFTEHTVEASRHAASSGIIYAEEIKKIEIEKKKDEGELEGKKSLQDT